MIAPRFFANPHFLAYARLLRELHQLIRAGTDEAEQGERLRERMDQPAEHLTSEEVDCLNGISADFYTLAGPVSESTPAPADLREQLNDVTRARDEQDFVKALELLRKNELYVDQAEMASMRASIWAQAGENEIAADFSRRANELAHENGSVVSHPRAVINRDHRH
jgi:hypothetical protein